ncbi:hypothetical protein [Dyella sp. GSA-30]|uniref:hypothetical protein n=1 Tax=Dyella sp. GSA-30 TaxID=2994496 RepID=UPI00248FC171|nr:hypothetical protein [Dyella sp. GSA-30]BDU19986.1 hypothetical protein DYGSA30_14430 [Dyella sp. GSA-30]
MKNYLVVYIGSEASFKASGWSDLSEAERQERERQGMAAWEAWTQAHKAAIVDMGAPLSRTVRVSPRGTENIKNALAAYTVVRAESYEAAAKMFEGHPHFTIFPGESVEIMECLPVPVKA